MKILTNVQTSFLAGIGQSFWSLLRGLEKDYPKHAQIVGVKIATDLNVASKSIYDTQKVQNFSLLSIQGESLPIFEETINKTEKIEGLIQSYSCLIENYQKTIAQESPDLILINGTYYIPWCLFMAAKETNIPIILHYHGILSKEVAHWPEKPRLLMNEMEKTFDNDRLFYLFPSLLARKTVEEEVFGHKICKCAVIPNPVPNHFFKISESGNCKNVGFVSRWSKVKNPGFIKKMVKYNSKKSDLYKINLISSSKESQKGLGECRGKVRLYKPMESEKLAKFYEKMGVLLSPSYFETYGNVAQEAIASGTPALINDNMGVAETYRKIGLDDFIVDFKSVANVYKKIGEVSGQKIPQKCRKDLKQIVSEKVISSEMLKVFKSI